MFRILCLVCLVVPFLTASPGFAGQLTREDWSRADKATVRLQPGAFPNLPEHVRDALEQRSCTIPQPYDAAGDKKNVVNGHFRSTATTDWAVLCSRERRSTILVFPGGRSDKLETLGDAPDLAYLQVTGDGHGIGYSRVITAATTKQVHRRFAQANHDGIEDSFTGKGSVLWYCSSGKWKRISSAD